MNKELNCLLTRVSDYMENKQDVNNNGDPNEEMNFVMEIEEVLNPALPQTDFTKHITVDALNAKQYIATLEADIRIWSDFETDTAKARVQITQQHLDMAKELFELTIPQTGV